MSTELREQIAKLLSDIPGEIGPDDEVKIINSAYKKLSASKKKINEESIIDAVLAAFKNEDEDEYYEDPYEDELLDLLRVSSYDDSTIRKAIDSFEKEASSEYDQHRGSKDAYYSVKGKDYRSPKQKDKEQVDEFEIIDGPHDDIEYHTDATKTENVKRTKSDMLSRSC